MDLDVERSRISDALEPVNQGSSALWAMMERRDTAVSAAKRLLAEVERLKARRQEAVHSLAEAKTVIGAIWHALGIPADADADIVAEVRDLRARDKPGCSWAHEELATVTAERDTLAGLLADISDTHHEGFGAGVKWASGDIDERVAAAEARGAQRMIDALRDSERLGAWMRARVVMSLETNGGRPWPPEAYPPSLEYADYLQSVVDSPTKEGQQ